LNCFDYESKCIVPLSRKKLKVAEGVDGMADCVIVKAERETGKGLEKITN